MIQDMINSKTVCFYSNSDNVSESILQIFCRFPFTELPSCQETLETVIEKLFSANLHALSELTRHWSLHNLVS